MNFILHGIGLAGGIAIGHAHLVSHARLEVGHYVIPGEAVADEIARFDAAIARTRGELHALRGNIPDSAPAEFEAFLDVHLLILDDTTLSAVPREIIERERCNAEWALKVQADALLERFDQIDDPYLRERRADVIQVVERLMKALVGQPGYAPPPADRDEALVLVAHDLSPADMLQFKQHRFAGFLTDVGGATSHTAVVARSLNIASVAALHHARSLIREDELVIVDGGQGLVIVDPDPTVLAEYRLRQDQWELERQKLRLLKGAPATTLDGTPIRLLANIELPEDVADVEDVGAAGVGLFRTEFLFLNRGDLPDEEEQYQTYRRVAEAMRGRPVTIRTYDLGADKIIEGMTVRSVNPALGLRAIRLCLTEPDRFQTQLRALLRASAHGRINILIPMLSGVAEIDQTLAQIAIARAGLDSAGVPYDKGVRIGAMIEVPAAAISLPVFLRKLDFVSIGTNDLIQYTLAIDRTDDMVAHLYDPLHPAVLSLVSQVIRGANRARVPVALCGEMAGDAALTRLLLGLGLRQFSMHPAQMLAVKQQVLRTDLAEVTANARRMLKMTDPLRMRALLQRINSGAPGSIDKEGAAAD